MVAEMADTLESALIFFLYHKLVKLKKNLCENSLKLLSSERGMVSVVDCA